MAEAFGLTVATWSPLAHGVLAGKPVAGGAEQVVVEEIKKIAAELNAT